MTTPMTKEALAELRYGDNLLWFLKELAAYDASDIDGGEFDVYGEDRNGHEGCATIDVTELAADAVKQLAAKDKRIAEQNVELFKQSADLAEISISRKNAWQQASAARKGFDEQFALREAAEQQVAELQSRAESAEQALLLERQKGASVHPAEFYAIAENIRTQDNRITADPMFCVYQTREIVVDEDYDCDRIVWVDEGGREATERQRIRLELLHQNFREPPEKWRRVAVKDIDDFVTCCFTEQGCKDYLACNGHNLRQPFIYVKGGFRNAEYIGIRNWLAGITLQKGGE